ncbi:hypothetical protein PWT90_07365 [Aphanocladium album]|nr:hypothetical protein PWT90_07365 [Aphanocladium album]
MSVDFNKVFVSDRLIYEAFDNADEDTKRFLYHQMARNPAIKGLDSIETFTPLSRSSYSETLAKWKHCFMSVIICLKPDNWDEITGDYTREEHTKGLRGTPIGMCVLSPQHPPLAQHRRVGMGISISQQHQGRGYGTEAIRWLADWTFTYANMHSLFLETSSLNEGAIHAYRKAGFVEDGRDRESLYIAGKWYDTVHMSMLEHEWRASRAAAKSSEA